MAALVSASALKLLAFAWCVFPAMSGVYPVLGVSTICDCQSWRREALQMQAGIAGGRSAFMERLNSQQRASTGMY